MPCGSEAAGEKKGMSNGIIDAVRLGMTRAHGDAWKTLLSIPARRNKTSVEINIPSVSRIFMHAPVATLSDGGIKK